MCAAAAVEGGGGISIWWCRQGQICSVYVHVQMAGCSCAYYMYFIPTGIWKEQKMAIANSCLHACMHASIQQERVKCHFCFSKLLAGQRGHTSQAGTIFSPGLTWFCSTTRSPLSVYQEGKKTKKSIKLRKRSKRDEKGQFLRSHTTYVHTYTVRRHCCRNWRPSSLSLSLSFSLPSLHQSPYCTKNVILVKK